MIWANLPMLWRTPKILKLARDSKETNALKGPQLLIFTTTTQLWSKSRGKAIWWLKKTWKREKAEGSLSGKNRLKSWRTHSLRRSTRRRAAFSTSFARPRSPSTRKAASRRAWPRSNNVRTHWASLTRKRQPNSASKKVTMKMQNKTRWTNCAKFWSSGLKRRKWLTWPTTSACRQLCLKRLSGAPKKKRICTCITIWGRKAVNLALCSATRLRAQSASVQCSLSWKFGTTVCTRRCSNARVWSRWTDSRRPCRKLTLRTRWSNWAASLQTQR